MTTIAYKDGVLAADKAISGGSGHLGTARKVFRRKSDGALVGGCGRVARLQSWIDWFLAGERGVAPKLGDDDTDDAEIIVVRPDGQVEIWERCGKTLFDADYYAMGSGGDFALGAMGAGASARQSIGVAARHDHATGHGVQFVKLS